VAAALCVPCTFTTTTDSYGRYTLTV